MQTLKEGAHIVYIVGFQAGGGVYMDAKYSGPDTDNNKILMLSGVASSRYFSKCTPASLSPAAGVPPIQADAPVEYSPFTICLFKSEVGGLSQTPRIGDAVAFNQISYVGKGSVPIVDLHDLANFRQYVPGTPEANYVWAIYGSLRTVTPGNYNLCISSDDGCDNAFSNPHSLLQMLLPTLSSKLLRFPYVFLLAQALEAQCFKSL
jgi:hypothetical protein